MITVIARWTVESSNMAKVLELLSSLVKSSRAEPGCLVYIPYVEQSNPNSILMYEQYKSPEAVEAHRSTEHFQKIALAQIIPLLATRAIEVLQAVNS